MEVDKQDEVHKPSQLNAAIVSQADLDRDSARYPTDVAVYFKLLFLEPGFINIQQLTGVGFSARPG